MSSKIKGIIAFTLLISVAFNLSTNISYAETAEVNSVESSVEKNVQLLPSLGDYNQSNNLVAREYVLGASDTIEIDVLGSDELSNKLLIQPDGKISIPYMEDFYVAGKTVAEVQLIISDRYSEYLNNPVINVKVTQSRPFIVYISGAILCPGSYELNTRTNQSSASSRPEAFIERKTPLLSNVLVAAGGLTCEANAENVTITNDLDGTLKKVNLLKLIKDSDSSQDMYLMAGDRIHIPKFKSKYHIDENKYKTLVSSTLFQKTIPVKVVGYVKDPGLITLKCQQSANLSSALAKAGMSQGKSAYMPSKVIVTRPDGDNNNKLCSFKVDPRQNDIPLMANDIIYVPLKIRHGIGLLFDYMGRLASPFYMGGRAYNEFD